MDMIKLIADKTWWPDDGHLDGYRTANYDLWMTIKKDVIEECTKERSDKLEVSPQCNLVKGDAPEGASLPVLSSRYNSADPKSILRQNQWPVALMKNYPQLGEILNRSRFQYDSYFSRDSRLKIEDNCNLPFSINTLEELELYHKTCSSATRNIWDNPNDSDKSPNDSEDVLTRAFQLQSYPSVSLPPRQCPAPRLPDVFDSTYENEVFPYRQIEQQNVSCQEKEGMKNTIENSSMQLFQPMFQHYDCGKQAAPPNKSENVFRQNLNWFNEYVKNLPVENLEQTLTWLRTVYPRRANDFQCLTEMIKIYSHAPHGLQNDVRPLYSHVVGAKGSKDRAIEEKLEQLEYEGMLQYLQSSDTSLVSASEDLAEVGLIEMPSSTNSEIERQYERLEKEALEQFVETEEDEEEFYNQQSILYEENTKFFVDHPLITTSSSDSCSIAVSQEHAVEMKISSENFTEEWKDSSTLESDGPMNTVIFVNGEKRKHYIKVSKDKLKKQPKMRKNKKKNQSKQSSSNHLRSLNVKSEISRLAASLKYKVLSYLKSTDCKINEMDKKRVNKRVCVRKSGDLLPIQHIKVTDIKEADTFHKYVKEFSQKVRSQLDTIHKRIRADLMESISKDQVRIIGPSSAEKRRTRQMISKCVQLLKIGNNMKIGKRHLVESSIKVINDSLKIIHKTMEVVYSLRDMTRETCEAVEYLRNGLKIITELYRDNVTLYDKSEYVRSRLLWESRSILIQLLCPRKRSIFCAEQSLNLKDIFDNPYFSVFGSAGMKEFEFEQDPTTGNEMNELVSWP